MWQKSMPANPLYIVPIDHGGSIEGSKGLQDQDLNALLAVEHTVNVKVPFLLCYLHITVTK